jgi:xanthine dehydrogenase accessory factor
VEVDATSAICVLTHDEKFDVPALLAALETPAVYIGAMGSRVTTADREERLRAEGVDDAGIARIHAPIGLAIGARSPEEVAVAIGAEIVQATAAARRRAAAEADVVSLLS